MEKKQQTLFHHAVTQQTKLTPMMQQYMSIKQHHKEHLLFYRLGDFYELFFEDALTASETLDIVLTKRGKHEENDVPMCGVPAHSSEYYIQKLIKNGYSIAVCEQLESPEVAKKRGYKAIVKREVVRIITPGTILEDKLLDAKSSNYLIAIAEVQDCAAISWIDISTGEFYVNPVSNFNILSEIARLSPKEIVISETSLKNKKLDAQLKEFRRIITTRTANVFDFKRCEEKVKNFYSIASISGIGDFNKEEVVAVGVLIEYIQHTQKDSLPRVSYPKKLTSGHYMQIDFATRSHLEIEKSIQGTKGSSLLSVMDKTVTSAGGRLLRLHLNSPLCNKEAINQRLDNLEFFLQNQQLMEKIREYFKHFPDIERSLARACANRGGPRDIALIRDGLRISLMVAELIKTHEAKIPIGIISAIGQIGNFGNLLEELKAALNEEVPMLIKDGGFIKKGYNASLDKLYDLKNNSNKKILLLREKYRKKTEITNLKLLKNNVLGFFIEVSNTNAPKITQKEFIHRQTLGSVVRYTTDELKELENDILNSDDKITSLESEIFHDLCEKVKSLADNIILASQSTATIDVAASLANLALSQGYVRPIIDEGNSFGIEGGRHPVVEKLQREEFVANSCNFTEGDNFWLITGPNMAGKSTFLRQNALIAIMAQIGSFVPAKSAKIGLIDKLFSRIGASDNIAKGESTFMVEMLETAYILNNVTKKSFVILDEIGRGTSTYDGMSIAWAVIENLHNSVSCRTLFATHYHELTNLEDHLDNLKCYTMSAKEWQGKVVFLHEIKAGKADSSYGIHVAELAGIPQNIINRAYEVLNNLTSKEEVKISVHTDEKKSSENPKILDILNKIDIDSITPRDAHNMLYKLKNLINN